MLLILRPRLVKTPYLLKPLNNKVPNDQTKFFVASFYY